jgi:hypothetical protein
VVFEGFPSDEDVSGIVFDEQDVDSAESGVIGGLLRLRRWVSRRWRQ